MNYGLTLLLLGNVVLLVTLFVLRQRWNDRLDRLASQHQHTLHDMIDKSSYQSLQTDSQRQQAELTANINQLQNQLKAVEAEKNNHKRTHQDEVRDLVEKLERYRKQKMSRGERGRAPRLTLELPTVG